MSYYPTEEEEYELMYGDDLEALKDCEEGSNFVFVCLSLVSLNLSGK